MPKIVDHDRHREDLARRAIPVFRDRGYHALSMREIAKHLGVSKSSLYHYFASKKHLFEVAAHHGSAIAPPSLAPDASIAERRHALEAIAREIEEILPGELSLILDYTRDMNLETIAADRQLGATLEPYRHAIACVLDPAAGKPAGEGSPRSGAGTASPQETDAGPSPSDGAAAIPPVDSQDHPQVDAVLAQLFGLLLIRYIDGRRTGFHSLEWSIRHALGDGEATIATSGAFADGDAPVATSGTRGEGHAHAGDGRPSSGTRTDADD